MFSFEKSPIRYKVMFPYQINEEEVLLEGLWCIETKLGVQVDNIPFYISNLSVNDIIEIDIQDSVWYYKEHIYKSMHNTIQVRILNDSTQNEIGEKYAVLGCTWEGSHEKNYISIDVPRTVSYHTVHKQLTIDASAGRIDFKEASLRRDENY